MKLDKEEAFSDPTGLKLDESNQYSDEDMVDMDKKNDAADSVEETDHLEWRDLMAQGTKRKSIHIHWMKLLWRPIKNKWVQVPQRMNLGKDPKDNVETN